MRRSSLVLLLATACLVAIWSLATGAQDFDPTACEASCHERKSACITACGEHANPVDCESQCEDTLEDCLEQCR